MVDYINIAGWANLDGDMIENLVYGTKGST